jgi:arsenate reductase (thioredoxin)
MGHRVFNVLFLCAGNSARSVIAEAILNKIGGRFRAFSAGSQPTGEVHPQTLRLLRDLGYHVGAARSKSWSEFARPGAPQMDFIFTVCGSAAGQSCPIWPGTPTTAHWGIPDPVAVEGTDEDVEAAFKEAYQRLLQRIAMLAALPIAELNPETLRSDLRTIGESGGAAAFAKGRV